MIRSAVLFAVVLTASGASIPPITLTPPAQPGNGVAGDVVQVNFLDRLLSDGKPHRRTASTRHRTTRQSPKPSPRSSAQSAPAVPAPDGSAQPPVAAVIPVPIAKPTEQTQAPAAAPPPPDSSTDKLPVPPPAAPAAEPEKHPASNPAPVTQPAAPVVEQPATATEPAHQAEVPTPTAKPEENRPAAADGKDATAPDATKPTETKPEEARPGETTPEGKPGEEQKVEPPAPPPPPPIAKEDPEELKACLADLATLGTKFQPIASIDDGEGCGIDKPIDVAEILPGVNLGGATMRCQTAQALGHWLKDTVQPALNIAMPGRRIVGLVPGSTYACRLRNNAATGKISEHAHGNAYDVAAFKFDNGEKMEMKPRGDDHTMEGAFQRTATAGACLHFTTVLAPGSDASHETHMHLDVIERKGGYRICE